MSLASLDAKNGPRNKVKGGRFQMRRQGSAYFRKTIQEDKVSKNPGSRVTQRAKALCWGTYWGLWGKGGIMEERKEREGGWCTQQRCRLLVDKEGRRGAGSGASSGQGKSYPTRRGPASRVVTPSQGPPLGDSQESVPPCGARPATAGHPRPGPGTHPLRSPSAEHSSKLLSRACTSGLAPTPSSLLLASPALTPLPPPRGQRPRHGPGGGGCKATTLPGGGRS